MKRILLCLIPASFAWGISLYFTIRFGSDIKTALLCGFPFFVFAFVLGWQATRPGC